MSLCVIPVACERTHRDKSLSASLSKSCCLEFVFDKLDFTLFHSCDSKYLFITFPFYLINVFSMAYDYVINFASSKFLLSNHTSQFMKKMISLETFLNFNLFVYLDYALTK